MLAVYLYAPTRAGQLAALNKIRHGCTNYDWVWPQVRACALARGETEEQANWAVRAFHNAVNDEIERVIAWRCR